MLAAVFVQCHARRVTYVFERAVAFVDIELLRSRIVDDHQIEQVILVDVHER